MEESMYKEFGPLWDDDHENLLGGYFAPNGDYYLTLQHVDPRTKIKDFPISFRISLSGSHISMKSMEVKKKLIELLKLLPKDTVD